MEDMEYVKLSEQWMPQIMRLVKTSYVPNLEPEDLKQELLMVLLKCHKNFDPARAKFHTLFYTAALHRIGNLKAAEGRHNPSEVVRYQDKHGASRMGPGKPVVVLSMEDIMEPKDAEGGAYYTPGALRERFEERPELLLETLGLTAVEARCLTAIGENVGYKTGKGGKRTERSARAVSAYAVKDVAADMGITQAEARQALESAKAKVEKVKERLSRCDLE